MYQNSYEDYMKQLLGYSCDDHVCEEDKKKTTYHPETIEVEDMSDTEELENEEQYIELYPEIYKMVYPVVCKACMQETIQGDITEEIVMKITNEVYEAMEADETPQMVPQAHVHVQYRAGSNFRNQRNSRGRNSRTIKLSGRKRNQTT